MLGTPPQDRVTGQLCPIIADNHTGLSAALDQGRQFTRDTAPRDGGIRDRREAFSGDVIDHVEHPEALAVGELVVDKIQRPACIGSRLDQNRGTRPDRLAPRLPLAHRQSFLAVEPIDTVDPRRLTLAAQQNEQAPVTEPPALVGQVPQPTAQHCVRRALRSIADHRAIRADDVAGPPFRQAMLCPKIRNGFALPGGPYHFFETRSFIAARSSICSARSFFSLAFSSSSAFSRLASDTVMPPNLAFQL